MVELGSYTFGVVTFGWVLLSTEATAQIGGTVQDGSGFPIPLANVELWSAGGVLESPLSDSSGRFSFSPVPSARGVRVSALGMTTIRGPLGDPLRALVVILDSQPLNLPQIEISATPFSCPEKDDPEVRGLWGKVFESSPIPPAGSYWGAGIIQMKERITWKGEFGELEQITPEWPEVQGETAQVFGGRWDPDSLVRVGCGRRREARGSGSAAASLARPSN